MVHDLGSIFSNNTYEDSVILQVPSLQDGVVMGREIPVEEGYYKYLGEIVIQKEKLQVNLSFDNTDEKKAEPISWNGNYVFLQDSLEHAHNTNFVK